MEMQTPQNSIYALGIRIARLSRNVRHISSDVPLNLGSLIAENIELTGLLGTYARDFKEQWVAEQALWPIDRRRMRYTRAMTRRIQSLHTWLSKIGIVLHRAVERSHQSEVVLPSGLVLRPDSHMRYTRSVTLGKL